MQRPWPSSRPPPYRPPHDRHRGLEPRRDLGTQRRPLPRRHRPGAGRPLVSRGPSSTGGPTASPPRCSAAGAQHQDKVAQYLYNCPEYLESMFGLYKAGLVPVNTNYRYTDDELAYLWDNADAVAVVFHGTFTEHCEHMRARRAGGAHLDLGRRRHTARAPTGPFRYETAAATAPPTRACAAVGPQPRRPVHPLHRRHHRHAQGRDVAPGRHGRQPRRAVEAPAARRARLGRVRRSASPSPARATCRPRR